MRCTSSHSNINCELRSKLLGQVVCTKRLFQAALQAAFHVLHTIFCTPKSKGHTLPLRGSMFVLCLLTQGRNQISEHTTLYRAGLPTRLAMLVSKNLHSTWQPPHQLRHHDKIKALALRIRKVESTTCLRQLVHSSHVYCQATSPDSNSESVTMDFGRKDCKPFPGDLYKSSRMGLWESLQRSFNHIKENIITKGTATITRTAVCMSQYHWPVVSYVGAPSAAVTVGFELLLYPWTNGLGTWMPPISAMGMKASIGKKYSVRIEHPKHIAQRCNMDMGAGFLSSAFSSFANGPWDKSVVCNPSRR